MQRRHRRRQAQSETGAGLGAAGLQPHKSFHRMLAIGFRNSRPVIGDAEQHLIAVAPRLDQDLLAARPATASAPSGCAAATGLPYLIAFSTRLASAWLINSRLPCSGAGSGLDAQGHAVVFGQRLVKFVNAVGDVGGVEIVHVVARLPGLGARDHQQRIEGADQPVGFLDGPFQRGAVFGLVAGFRQRLFGAVAQPRQRRLQIVGDVVGDFLQPHHQRFDALQHGVEIFRQAIEFVAAAPDRQPPAEIARHDALGGAGHGVDAPQHPPRDKDAAAEAEHDHDQHRPLRGLRDDAEQPPALLEIAADQQPEAAGQFGDAHQRAMIGGVLIVEPAVGGLRPARWSPSRPAPASRHCRRCASPVGVVTR